jgi:TRAP-type C4-dicarboxylate transport system permease large subunit
LREVYLVAVGGRFKFVVIGPLFARGACRKRLLDVLADWLARLQAYASLVSTGQVVLVSKLSGRKKKKVGRVKQSSLNQEILMGDG